MSVSKQQFLVFKQHFMYFHILFYSHVFLQKFLNNNFQFLNTCTKRTQTFHHYRFQTSNAKILFYLKIKYILTRPLPSPHFRPIWADTKMVAPHNLLFPFSFFNQAKEINSFQRIRCPILFLDLSYRKWGWLG